VALRHVHWKSDGVTLAVAAMKVGFKLCSGGKKSSRTGGGEGGHGQRGWESRGGKKEGRKETAEA